MCSVKTENFCLLKDNIKVNERQGIYWEKKYVQHIYLIMDLYPEYVNNSYSSIKSQTVY